MPFGHGNTAVSTPNAWRFSDGVDASSSLKQIWNPIQSDLECS